MVICPKHPGPGRFPRHAWRWIPAALALGAMLLATGCATHLGAAQALMEEERFSEAQARLELGLEDHPEDPALNLLMARTRVLQDDLRSALPFAERAVKDPEAQPDAWRWLGKIHWELGQPIEAVRAWRSARSLRAGLVNDEDYIRGLEAAMTTAMALQDYAHAMELRVELATLAPNHAQADDRALRDNKVKLAEARVRDGDLEEAAAVYLDLWKTEPRDPKHALARGILLVKLARPDDARSALGDYLDADPSMELERTLEVAEELAKLDAIVLSAEFYTRSLNLLGGEPTFRRAQLRLTLADLLYKQRATDRAREAIRAYLRDMSELRGLPLSAEIYMTATEVAGRHEDRGFEGDLLETALTDAPPAWSLTEKIASRFARRAQSAEVDRVLNLFIERSGQRAEAKLQVARWAKTRRNYALAQRYLESVVEGDQVRREVWLELAHVYHTMGQVDRLKVALQAYRDRHELGRHDLLIVSKLYLEHRLYELAEDALLEAMKLDPGSLVFVDRLAELYEEWGQPQKVHQHYEAWAVARGEQAQDYLLIGNRFIRSQRPNLALQYLKKAAELGTADRVAGQAWLNIADIYRDQRRELEMRQALERFMAAEGPDQPSALRAVIVRYRSAGMIDEMIAALQRLVELEPHALTHYAELSRWYFERGREADALSLWSTYLDQADDRAEALSEVAETLERRGRLIHMLDIYEHLLDEAVDDAEIYRLIGHTYADIANRQRYGRPGDASAQIEEPAAKARRFFDAYLAQGDPSPSELRDLADALKEKRIWDISARLYDRLLVDAPSSSDLLLRQAEVMMELGELDRAAQLFNEFYEARGRLVEDAEDIATHLVQAKRFSDAKPYLESMLSSKKPNAVDSAFHLLSTVYRAAGRRDELLALVSRYLENAQNPAKARLEVIRELTNMGMFDAVAAQIRRTRSVQGDVQGLELAKNLFKAGDDAAAFEAFRDYADEHSYPSDAWVLVADFYWAHGETERAQRAYARAVAVETDNANALSARATFRIAQGDLEGGAADFADARDKVSSERKEELWSRQVQALQRAGRFAEAAASAREALGTATRYRDDFLEVILRRDLNAHDPLRRKRAVDNLKASSLPLREKVRLLFAADFHVEAAALAERRLTSGDPRAAADVILDRPQLLTSLGGYDRLERALQPLISSSDDGSSISGRLGTYFLHQGEYARGIPLLRAAVANGHREHRAELAQGYLATGYGDGASALFLELLDDVPTGNEAPALSEVCQRYEVLRAHDQLRQLLEQLLSNPRYRTHATALLVRDQADKGRLDRALEIMRRVSFPSADLTGEQMGELQTLLNRHGDAQLDTLVAALEALASAGYVREAADLAEALPDEDARVAELRIRLSAMRSSQATRALAGQLLDSTELAERHALRLDIARIAQANGHPDLARELAEPVLDALEYQDRLYAARFLIGNGFVRDDLGYSDSIARRFIDESENGLDATRQVAERFHVLGLDARAFDHIDAVSRAWSTPANLSVALGALRGEGRPDEFHRVFERALRRSEHPKRALRTAIEAWPRRLDWRFNQPLLDRYDQTFPVDFQGLTARITSMFVSGRVEAARERLDAYLRDVEYDPEAAQNTIRALQRYGLHAEVVRLARAPAPDLPPRARLAVGASAMHLGLEEQAHEHFMAYIETSPDEVVAHGHVARSLLYSGFPEAIAPYPKRALDAAPNRPELHFFAGIAAITKGDLDQARRMLSRSIGPGVSRTVALNEAARVALEHGHPQFAESLLEPLMRRPTASDPAFGLRLALRTFIEADRAQDGVKYLEARYPELAAGQGTLAREYFGVLALSNLYEAAGLPALARAAYQRVITRQMATAPNDRWTSTYLNNLAYSHATANADIDQGLSLARRSLAMERTRQPSTIDTLGWLYYRLGDNENALKWVGRGLRKERNEETGEAFLREFFEHMAILYQATGDSEAAAWYHVRATGEPSF